MFKTINQYIENIEIDDLSLERREKLNPLINYLQKKVTNKENIRLNFICTHNSRRSHLGKIWTDAMVSFYNQINIQTYSGGTEATALFPQIIETLKSTGFKIEKLSENKNPVYAIRYDNESRPIISFSKKYSHFFNPTSQFAAIMTCDHANQNCPVVHGAEARFALDYLDPKVYDGTPFMERIYIERSLQIATEMKYVFSQISNNSN